METIFENSKSNLKEAKYLKSITIKKLKGIARKYHFAIKANIFFKKENKDKEKGKICGIRLSVPGPLIYASSNENNFNLAINNTIKDLKIQLEKRKAILN